MRGPSALYTQAVTATIEQQSWATRARHPLQSRPRPFLRWAGGKRWLLPHIVDLLPTTFGTYLEPFAGSAALYYVLEPTPAVLGDSCRPLIETYEAVRDDVEGVLGHLAEWRVDRDTFDAVKAIGPQGVAADAARFIYLNHTCWNGLYRVNARGEFNVPYGRPKSQNTVDPENLRACARTLARDTTLVAGDFEAVAQRASAGDLVYLDPPYVTGHNNNGFVDYNELLFGWSDQLRLARLASDLDARGVHLLISNADHEAVLDLFGSFEIVRVVRHSTIAGSTAARKPTSEVLIFNTRRRS